MTAGGWALVALAGLVLAAAGLRSVSRSDAALGPPSSVALQSARTPERVEQLKALWGPRVPHAVAAIRWDFLLIAGYTALLVGAVGVSSPAVAELVGVRGAAVFWPAAGVALLAAACDAAENVASLSELRHPATASTAGAAVSFARAKWMLLALVAAWLLLAALPMALVRW